MDKLNWLISCVIANSMALACSVALAETNPIQSSVLQKPKLVMPSQSRQQSVLAANTLRHPAAASSRVGRVSSPASVSSSSTVLASASDNMPITDMPPNLVANNQLPTAGAQSTSQSPASLGVPASNTNQNTKTVNPSSSTDTNNSTNNTDANKSSAHDLSDMDTNPDLSQSFSASGKAASSLTLDQRLTRLEQQVINLINLNRPQKLASLQNQIQQLSGQVEVLDHNLKQLNKQQRTFYQTLDQRIDQIKTLSGSDSSNAQIYPSVKTNQKNALQTKDNMNTQSKTTSSSDNSSSSTSPSTTDNKNSSN